MTDTQDTGLIQGQAKPEEETFANATTATEATPEVVTEETPAAEAEATETAPAEEIERPTENLAKLSREEILERLKQLAEHAGEVTKAEIDNLKQAFYKLHNARVEAAKQAFIENGGEADHFKPTSDALEEEFKTVMAAIKEKRNAIAEALEKEKEMNYQVKLSIIEELKDLLETPEEANKNYTEFKRLQQQWNEVKLIPQVHANELWKNYMLYVEKFYDLLKLNNEFREYDFKKNLEIKTHLCEAAERLLEESDAVSAFHQLQKLHQEFREAGPVAKELREEIWLRFKNASTAINRRYQQHFEELKEMEQHNLDQKTVICEIIEAIEFDQLKTFADWDNKTEEITALQNKWRTIGYAPQKMNSRIFERFRAACDEFFRRKSEFYKSVKESMSANLEKKRQLCEKAEALKDSTDWKATTDILVKLQKEWKATGPVARKYSESIWKRFIAACDYFFEQKAKATSSQRTEEQANLEKKREIIAQVEALMEETDTVEAVKRVRVLMKEWNSIGHVPIRDKDRIYKQYRTAVDNLFDQLNLSASQKKLSNYRSSISSMNEGGNGLHRERERLVRILENMMSELKTYENNLGFLSASSKKGNSLVSEINRKVEKLKADIALMKEKIKVIDENS